MEPFRRLSSVAAPILQANVDTDIIFPARFLLLTQRAGLGGYAFHDWRHGPDGSLSGAFVLDRAPWAGARILVAGENFGGGSSREQALWALSDLGIRCVIAPGFGEIFRANCFRNGMLPIVVSPQQQAELMADAQSGATLTVDLVDQVVGRPYGGAIGFSIEPWRRAALLEGRDEVDAILTEQSAAIATFETRQRAASPWLYVQG
jgi:3-isopropylmalate dehydratase small subunit